MTPTMRSYCIEEDYWRIREFLRQVMIANNRRELCWHVARLDYWWWFVNPDIEKIPLEENVFIWETESGQIAAVLNPEGRGQAYLQIHPGFRTPELDEEMIALAEERLSVTNKDGQRKLQVFVDSQDKAIQRVLSGRGFKRVEEVGIRRFSTVGRWMNRCPMSRRFRGIRSVP